MNTEWQKSRLYSDNWEQGYCDGESKEDTATQQVFFKPHYYQMGMGYMYFRSYEYTATNVNGVIHFRLK